MSDLQGKGGELRGTIHVTRKATGKVETYEFTGPVSPEQEAAALEAVARHNRAHGAAGAMVGKGSIMSNEPKE